MQEKDLITYLKENIKKLIPSLEISTVKTEVKIDNKIVDMVIKTKEGDDIFIEVKSSGEPSYIFKAISQLKYYQTNKEGYLMVAVPNISEKGKAICKSLSVGYIDLKGNAFIKYKKILIDVVEERDIPQKFIDEKRRVSKIFSKNSFRVFIYLLRNPDDYFTQEGLSAKLGISRAYINRIFKTLEKGIKEEGDIIVFEVRKDKDEINKNLPNVQVIGRMEWVKKKVSNIKQTKRYKITNPGKLLDILIKKYDFSKNKVISFYSFEKNPNKLMDKIANKAREEGLKYSFTLHAGASLVAPFVRFEDIHFYTNEEDIPKWIKCLDLKRTEFGGNIFLVIPQYDWILEETIEKNKKKIINPIMLYLDLINYPKRGKEQADFLREEEIGF